MKSRDNTFINPTAGVLFTLILVVAPACECAAAADSDWSIEFSGQYRARVENLEDPFIGLSAVDDFTSLAHRILGSIRVDYKKRYGVYAQLGTFVEDGRKPNARSTDEGGPDFQQLYVDFLLCWDDSRSTIRLGRQEMSFGASRLISTRDNPNIRRSFDALKVTVPLEHLNIQAFVGRPVKLLDGWFDDKSDSATALWGLYTSFDRPDGGGTDVYYFGLDRDTAVFDQGVGAETRHTIGARRFGKHSGWDWDGEAAFQFGEFNDGDIRAWFIGGEVGRTWKQKWSPRVALRSHVFSGDDNPAEADLQTFNPLFPKTTFFTQAGLFSPTNAIDVHPLLSFSPTETLRVTTSIDFFWRYSTDDALYRPPLLPRIPGNANNERYLGTIWEILLKWTPTEKVDVTLAYDVGNVQGFISAAGGKNPRFLLASVQIAF